MATLVSGGVKAARPIKALTFMLGAALFLNYVDRGAIAVAAPLMKSELGLSATTFGIAVSAFFWVYAPLQLFAGWLCDRVSVYKLIAAGIMLWAVSTFLVGFVGGPCSDPRAAWRAGPSARTGGRHRLRGRRHRAAARRAP